MCRSRKPGLEAGASHAWEEKKSELLTSSRRPGRHETVTLVRPIVSYTSHAMMTSAFHYRPEWREARSGWDSMRDAEALCAFMAISVRVFRRACRGRDW